MLVSGTVELRGADPSSTTWIPGADPYLCKQGYTFTTMCNDLNAGGPAMSITYPTTKSSDYGTVWQVLTLSAQGYTESVKEADPSSGELVKLSVSGTVKENTGAVAQKERMDFEYLSI